jgi:hypothetical protein
VVVVVVVDGSSVVVVVVVGGGTSVVVLVVVLVEVELDVVVVVVPVQSPSAVQGTVPPVITIPSSPVGRVEEQTLILKPGPRPVTAASSL